MEDGLGRSRTGTAQRQCLIARAALCSLGPRLRNTLTEVSPHGKDGESAWKRTAQASAQVIKVRRTVVAMEPRNGAPTDER